MKKVNFKLLFLSALIAINCNVMASCQTQFLSALPSGEGIEKVYLSKMMLSMMNRDGDLLGNDFMKDILGGDNSLEVYECSKQDLIPSILESYDKIMQKYDKQILVEEENSLNKNMIYLLYSKGEDTTPIGMVISDVSETSLSITIITGKINLDGISKLMKY